MRFINGPQDWPVAVRISKVEDLASYHRWLSWHCNRSPLGVFFFFEDETKCMGLTGQAEDEKSQAKYEKAR